MIVVLKHNVPEEKRNQLINWLKAQGLDVHPSLGEYQTVLGLVGDTSRLDMSLLESLEIVDSVKRVTDPFKCCNRKFHPDDTVVSVGDAKFGGGHFAMIAGPCSVESEEQIVYVAKAVKAAGAQLLGHALGGEVLVDDGGHALEVVFVLPHDRDTAAAGSDNGVLRVHKRLDRGDLDDLLRARAFFIVDWRSPT